MRPNHTRSHLDVVRIGARGEDRPETVEQAIRLAHTKLTEAGVQLGTRKIHSLARSYVTIQPNCSFRSFLIRNAGPAVRSLPRPARGVAVEWLDITGDEASFHVDTERGETA